MTVGNVAVDGYGLNRIQRPNVATSGYGSGVQLFITVRGRCVTVDGAALGAVALAEAVALVEYDTVLAEIAQAATVNGVVVDEFAHIVAGFHTTDTVISSLSVATIVATASVAPVDTVPVSRSVTVDTGTPGVTLESIVDTVNVGIDECE